MGVGSSVGVGGWSAAEPDEHAAAIKLLRSKAMIDLKMSVFFTETIITYTDETDECSSNPKTLTSKMGKAKQHFLIVPIGLRTHQENAIMILLSINIETNLK